MKSTNLLFCKIYGNHISENAERGFVSVIIICVGKCRVDFPHFVSYSWVMEAFLPISNGDGRIWIFFWTSLLLEVTRSYLFSQVPSLLNVVLATNFKEIRSFCKGIIDFMVSIFYDFIGKTANLCSIRFKKKWITQKVLNEQLYYILIDDSPSNSSSSWDRVTPPSNELWI